MYATSPQRIVGDAGEVPMVVRQTLPVGGTSMECARAKAISTEQLRYTFADGYSQESRVLAAANVEANISAVASNEDFCNRLTASQKEAETKEARHKAEDLAYYNQATSTRRWPISPVSTRWGTRQAPF
eukprot:TRINITY_DN750_c0_g1_i1.p1 TRINITY_DN750_c0_g1~~TRINITY_DN750_c0_g1_i1.p1  ORF type:complete len:149 (+),score=26.15 TRINITY_DN750_c0_g1_i1:62-448(+)